MDIIYDNFCEDGSSGMPQVLEKLNMEVYIDELCCFYVAADNWGIETLYINEGHQLFRESEEYEKAIIHDINVTLAGHYGESIEPSEKLVGIVGATCGGMSMTKVKLIDHPVAQ